MPQAMPAALPETAPVPVPVLITWRPTLTVNVAVAARSLAWRVCRWRAARHAPLQPLKVEPAAATAVSVTGHAVREASRARRAAGDPGRAARDRATPVPVVATSSTGNRAKLAVADLAALIGHGAGLDAPLQRRSSR